MKRALKSLLLAGVVAGTLIPAAPASADTCIGILRDAHTGEEETGVWECDRCPSSPVTLLDGRMHVIVCLSPR